MTQIQNLNKQFFLYAIYVNIKFWCEIETLKWNITRLPEKTNTNNQIILCMLNQILGYDENPKMAD